MKKVCIDTDILGWAIKGYSTDGNKEKVKKSEILLAYLGNTENIEIVIPTIVLAEMLCDVKSKDKREDIIDYIGDCWFLASYNVSAAKIFGEINAERTPEEKKQQKEDREKNCNPKANMKNDWNICATALAHKCDTIFTNNVRDFKGFAGDRIRIESLDYVEKIKYGKLSLFQPNSEDNIS